MVKRSTMRWSRRLGVVGLVWFAVQACFGQGVSADRVVQPVDGARTVALQGNVHPLARLEFDQGEVNGAMVLPRVTVFFSPSASQQASLDALLAEQQDRTSPNYHRWLTPEQFGEQFGLSAADLAKVTAWLQGQGFTVVETARSRNWIAFSGTAQQVSAALGTRIHRYAVRGETHFANASEPLVPAALADVVGGFRGLNDFRLRARATATSVPSVGPNFTSGQTGNHFVTPGDFATIYDVNPLYANGIDGTGEKIAVMGQTDITLSDVAAFRAAAGLSVKPPQVVPIGTEPNVSPPDLPEADLDVEWAGAVAKNATIVYVTSSNGVLDSMQYAITNNLAPVISISYGACEQEFGSSSEINSLSGTAQQANAEGITIVAAAGDAGATDCDTNASATLGLAVDLPASLPYVTGMGGTMFNEGSGMYWQATAVPPPNGTDIISSALSYIPEVVWNQSPASGPLLATGGGASAKFSKPVWQVGAGVPNDGARDVPDASFAAAPNPDGYLTCSQSSCVNGFRNSNGSLNEIGGTSAAVPTFAGVVALVNQQTKSSGQGNVNKILYALSAASPGAFHDIQSGSNAVLYNPADTPDCAQSSVLIGYNATAGYDLATGLGSIDANNLVTNWTSVSAATGGATSASFQLAFASQALTFKRGACGTAQVILTPINGFSGTPAMTCAVPAGLTGGTCAVFPGPLNTFVLIVDVPAAASAAAPRMWDFPLVGGSRWRSGIWIGAVGILLMACFGTRRRLAPALVILAVLAIVAGCGGGSTSTASGGAGASGNSVTGVVSVTGTIGAISQTAQITITAD